MVKALENILLDWLLETLENSITNSFSNPKFDIVNNTLNIVIQTDKIPKLTAPKYGARTIIIKI